MHQQKSSYRSSLRKTAEEVIRHKPKMTTLLQLSDIQKIVHELDVHQAELEIQNEKLRRTQQELMDSRNRYEELYDFAPVGYFTLDREGRILQANLTAAKMLGIERSKLTRRSGFSTFVSPKSQDIWHKYRLKVMECGEKQTCELDIVTADNSILNVDLETICISKPNEKEPILMMAMVDITERKKAQEALKKTNMELEQFAHVAYHDLQEPLRAINSFAELFATRYRNQIDDRADEYIEFIVDGVGRMQRLIEDFLSLSRVGHINIERSFINSSEIVDRIITNIKKSDGLSGAEISRDDLPVLLADKKSLTLLFQNLLGNAVKFHKEGESPVVHLSALEKDNEWLFSVKDNGIGINEKYFEKLFVIFRRLHGKQDYPGTGIGLAIAKKIVESYGGRIWVESREGEGSTFYFTFPRL